MKNLCVAFKFLTSTSKAISQIHNYKKIKGKNFHPFASVFALCYNTFEISIYFVKHVFNFSREYIMCVKEHSVVYDIMSIVSFFGWYVIMHNIITTHNFTFFVFKSIVNNSIYFRF